MSRHWWNLQFGDVVKCTPRSRKTSRNRICIYIPEVHIVQCFKCIIITTNKCALDKIELNNNQRWKNRPKLYFQMAKIEFHDLTLFPGPAAYSQCKYHMQSLLSSSMLNRISAGSQPNPVIYSSQEICATYKVTRRFKELHSSGSVPVITL